MRKIVLLIMMLVGLQAGHIEEFAHEYGYETSYEAAKTKALKEQKPIMLLMVTHYCPWCRKFEQKTLRDPKIDKQIKAHFIPVILNRELQAFPKQFDTPRIPTTFFIDPKSEKATFKSMGYKTVTDFNNVLQLVIHQ